MYVLEFNCFTIFLEHYYRISWFFAVALAHHTEVDNDFLIDAHWVDLNGLVPLPGVLGALQDLDLCGELDSGPNSESRALVSLTNVVSTTAEKE